MSFISNTRAAAFVEYTVLLGLVGAVSVFAVLEFGGTQADTFKTMSDTLVTHGVETAQAAVRVEAEGGGSLLAANAPTAWTGAATGAPVCANAISWSRDNNTGVYGGQVMSQTVGAFWFGPNPPVLPAMTAGGVPIYFAIPDYDSDGWIDSVEAAAVAGFHWTADESRSVIFYHSVNPAPGDTNAAAASFGPIVFTDANADLVADEGDLYWPTRGNSLGGWELSPEALGAGVSC